jgi:hypothetical protein
MLALAYLAPGRRQRARHPAGPVISSASEIRRMFTALCSPPPSEQHARRRSRWRLRHQERSRKSRYQRQQKQDYDLRLEYWTRGSILGDAQ